MITIVTGVAGFIGFHSALKLLDNNHKIIGIDNLNSYYSVELKEARLKILEQHKNFKFLQFDLKDELAVNEALVTYKPDNIIHLAAQAGVRYSLTNPNAYIDSNIVAFHNILLAAAKQKVKHFLFASSSSVYGGNIKQPFSEEDNVDHPISLYAASKKANELIAHSYAHLYKLPVTGLRFFTVYGPWGRPDMALFKFVKGINEGISIDVYNNGDMARDFTYIDDVTQAIAKLTIRPATANPSWPKTSPAASSFAPYRIYNIGNQDPVKLMDFIQAIENKLGKKAKFNFLPMQPGDVPKSSASTEQLANDIGFAPKTSITDGIANFVDWYLSYYS